MSSQSRATPPALFPPPPDHLGKGVWEFTANNGIASHDLLLPVRMFVFLRLNPARLARASYSDH